MTTAALPSISVVIPTLREAHNIGGLLESLLCQSHAPLEIIVADGGSQDGTLEASRSTARLHPQVLGLACERGTSRQRNAGAALASGELLVFMDADDRAPRDFLLHVARSHRRWRFAVACPWFTVREPQLSVRAAYFGFNLLFFLGQGWLRMGSGVCIIVERPVFEAIGGFDEGLHLGEDIHLIRRASRLGLHRHLLIPLETSGRRYRSQGFWRLSLFYLKITPLLALGLWKHLRRLPYQAAPYAEPNSRASPEPEPARESSPR